MLFLEEDWQLVSPAPVTATRLADVLDAIRGGHVDFVNMRHKLHYGAPCGPLPFRTQIRMLTLDENPTAEMSILSQLQRQEESVPGRSGQRPSLQQAASLHAAPASGGAGTTSS